MRLDTAVYGGLLTAGLAFAYWASIPEDDGDQEGKVNVATFDPKLISEISVDAKDAATGLGVSVVALRRAGDDRFWIEHSKSEAAPPAKAADASKEKALDKMIAAATATASPPVVTTERFLGNEKFEEILKGFEPLSAVRVIGQVDEKQREEFGLSKGTGKLTLKTTDGKVWTLALGKTSYGSRNRFAMEGDASHPGRVLLIEGDGIDGLEKAPLRLFDRRLVSFEFIEADKASIITSGQNKRLAHTLKDKNGELLWTDDEASPTAKPSLDSWMDKVSKLRLVKYAADDKEKLLTSVQPFLEISFEKDGKVIDSIRFKKDPTEAATYWVTSEFLKVHGQVASTRMESIEKDASTVVGSSKS